VRQAIAFAEPTDFPNLQGDTLLAAAEVLRLAGRADEASRRAAEAIARYERKGNVTSAREARLLLSELQPV
jgi:hypothetical protein